MKIIGHRGCMVHAPENTLAAFETAWAEGADGIECDVHLTLDSKVVVHHDSTLVRTAGKPLKIAELTYRRLRLYDVGRWKGKAWARQRIPSLEDLLQKMPAGKLALVEIKCGEKIVPVLKQMSESGLLKRDIVLFVGFSEPVMRAIKAAMPEYTVLLNIEPEEYEQRRDAERKWLRVVRRAGLDGIGAGIRNFDPVTFEYWKSLGMKLFAWTVQSRDVAVSLKRIGVELIAADCPAMLRDWLSQS